MRAVILASMRDRSSVVHSRNTVNAVTDPASRGVSTSELDRHTEPGAKFAAAIAV